MALKATIFKAELQVSDLDRHYYASHSLTIARHPSETDERMMVRLVAFALFWVDSIPLLSQARRFAAKGIAPDGSRVNVRNLRPRSDVGSDVTDDDFLLLCDAQTSGGLLVALPAEQGEAYAERSRERGAESAAVVGRVEARGTFPLAVRRHP